MKPTLFIKIAGLVALCHLTFCTPVSFSPLPLDHDVKQIARLISSEDLVVGNFDVVNLSRHIVSLSRYYNLDPLLVLSIIKVESQFQPSARSPSGAIGLMQLTSGVVKEAGSTVSVAHREDLYDPYKNLRLGIYYFNNLLEKYRNNLPKALAAYNIGPTALDALMSQEEATLPTNYSQHIMQCYRAYKKKALPSPDLI